MTFGRGRDEYATTPTVRECYHLDSDRLTDVLDGTQRWAYLTWGGDPDPTTDDHDGRLKVVVIDDDVATRRGDSDALDVDDLDDRPVAIRLQYTTTERRTGDQREFDYRVPIEWTPCNFGGARPWFLCPGSPTGDRATCGERVGKLYRPRSRRTFLCRHCHDLGYYTSRRSHDDVKMAAERYRRVYDKLANERPHPGEIVPLPPDRPTGMHHDTYRDLVKDLFAARRDWHEAQMAKLRKLAEGTDINVPDVALDE